MQKESRSYRWVILQVKNVRSVYTEDHEKHATSFLV